MSPFIVIVDPVVCYDVSISKPFGGENYYMDLWVLKRANQVSLSGGFQVPHCIHSAEEVTNMLDP